MEGVDVDRESMFEGDVVLPPIVVGGDVDVGGPVAVPFIGFEGAGLPDEAA